MVWVNDNSYISFVLDLVDGYIPRKEKLLGMGKTLLCPYSNEVDRDSFFQYIADSVRKSFCTAKDKHEKRSASHCEAWLLKPENDFGPGFDLVHPRTREKDRRMIVTLHYNCEIGGECLQHLLDKTGVETIPENKYRDNEAFWEEVSKIFDVVSTPFSGPCVVAKEGMEKMGYNCFGFGR